MARIAEQADGESVHSAGSEAVKAQLIHPNECLKSLRAFVEEARKDL